MNRWILMATVALLLMPAGLLLANPIVVPEKPTKPTDKNPPTAAAPMNVQIDDKATEPRLIIPKKVLNSLRADAGGGDPNTQWADAGPSWHLIVAGVALTAALAMGGLWFVRGRRKPGALVLLLTGTALVVTAGMVWANAGRPEPPPAPGLLLSDKVKIEVVDQGDTIVLVATRDQLTKILDKK